MERGYLRRFVGQTKPKMRRSHGLKNRIHLILSITDRQNHLALKTEPVLPMHSTSTPLNFLCMQRSKSKVFTHCRSQSIILLFPGVCTTPNINGWEKWRWTIKWFESRVRCRTNWLFMYMISKNFFQYQRHIRIFILSCPPGYLWYILKQNHVIFGYKNLHLAPGYRISSAFILSRAWCT